MIALEIIGSDAVMQRFISAPGKIRTAAKSSLDAWATRLAQYIRAEKLSGNPLHVRSGRLSSSIHGWSEDNAQGVSGAAGGGKDVPYAKIHEFGFEGTEQVRAHLRMQTMAFGKRITPVEVMVNAFSRHMVMPERSYMRSSLREQAPDGIAQLRAAVKEAILS